MKWGTVHTDWLTDAKAEVYPPQLHNTAKSWAEKVKPQVPFSGLLYGAFRHTETIHSQMVGWLMKENLGKKVGKWSNWDTEWEFEDKEKNLKIVDKPATR